MCRRPLPTAAVQLLLFCFFNALLLLLPSQGNALWCGYGQRTESKVWRERTQLVCDSSEIACFLASCSSASGEKEFFAWGCSKFVRIEDTNCTKQMAAAATKEHPSTKEWTCNCTFGKEGESVDMGPPDLPTTTTTKAPLVLSTTTTTKRSRSTKSGGGKESGGGRLIVKTHLVFSLQMFIGFVPAMFVGLRS